MIYSVFDFPNRDLSLIVMMSKLLSIAAGWFIEGDKEKIPRCPKSNYSRPEGGRKRQKGVHQLTAVQNQQKTAHTP